MATNPEVFIVESLEFSDEDDGDFEGRILTDMLRMSGKKPRYYYVRTRREIKKVLNIFEDSQYRYLHFSCHGNEESISTTLDVIKFEELGEMLRPYLKNRRLFMSSCEVVNDNLAKAVMKDSDCNSIVGPSAKVFFDQAAVMWASFYHLAFREDDRRIKRREIRSISRDLSKLFKVPLVYCRRDSRLKKGYRIERFKI